MHVFTCCAGYAPLPPIATAPLTDQEIRRQQAVEEAAAKRKIDFTKEDEEKSDSDSSADQRTKKLAKKKVNSDLSSRKSKKASAKVNAATENDSPSTVYCLICNVVLYYNGFTKT